MMFTTITNKQTCDHPLIGKGLSRNDVTFLGGEGGQPKSDEKWSGGGGVSALFSKAKVTSFLDSP